jgi:polyphosphate kinase
MGFCTDEQYKQFMSTVNDFESLLIGSDIQLIKYYLDISKEEQAARLKDRAKDPLKQWKISPIDQKAQKMWNAYSVARDKMLKQTSSTDAPWTVVNANDKKLAHLNLIADLLSRVDYPDKDKKILKIDPKIVMACPTNSKTLPKLFK